MFLTKKKLFLSSSRPHSFLAEAWAARVGLSPEDVFTFKGKRQLKENNPITCSKNLCLFRKDALTIAYLKKLDDIETACAEADILVAAEPLRKHKYVCRHPHIIIDRFDVFYRGAHLVTEKAGKWQIETVKEKQGNRPWSIGNPKR